MDILTRNAIYFTIKLGKVSMWVALMHQKMTNACKGEARAIANAKVEIANLKRASKLKSKT